MAEDKFRKVAFVVTSGVTPGVYDTRTEAQKQTNGVSGSRFRGFTAAEGGRTAAEAEFKRYLETIPKPEDAVGRRAGRGTGHASQHTQSPSTISAAPLSTAHTHASQLKRRNSQLSENGRLPKSQRLAAKNIREFAYKENEENMVIPNGKLGKVEKPQAGLNPEYSDLDDLDDESLSDLFQTNKSATDYIALGEPMERDEFDDKSWDETFAQYEMIQKHSERPLCQEQSDLIELILTGKNVFYTGSAGCGKSTVLNCFQRCLKEMSKKVFIIAPTGRAALDINGVTFWSYAGWTPDSMKRSIRELERDATKKRVRERLQETDVLVIDEISMMENHHFERLNRVMQWQEDATKLLGASS